MLHTSQHANTLRSFSRLREMSAFLEGTLAVVQFGFFPASIERAIRPQRRGVFAGKDRERRSWGTSVRAEALGHEDER